MLWFEESFRHAISGRQLPEQRESHSISIPLSEQVLMYLHVITIGTMDALAYAWDDRGWHACSLASWHTGQTYTWSADRRQIKANWNLIVRWQGNGGPTHPPINPIPLGSSDGPRSGWLLPSMSHCNKIHSFLFFSFFAMVSYYAGQKKKIETAARACVLVSSTLPPHPWFKFFGQGSTKQLSLLMPQTCIQHANITEISTPK